MPLELDPAMAGEGDGDEEDGCFFGRWSLGDWKTEAEGRHGEEKKNFCPLIGGENANRPSHSSLKLRLFPMRPCARSGWVTQIPLMRIP